MTNSDQGLESVAQGCRLRLQFFTIWIDPKPANNYNVNMKIILSSCVKVAYTRLLPKEILKGPSELKAQNLGAQHMK